MSTEIVFALLTVLGVGGISTAIVNSFLGRRKERAEISKAQADTLGSTIETSAKTIIDYLRTDNDQLRNQMDQIENKLDATRAELATVRGVMHSERAWAALAHAELRKIHPTFPEPPILFHTDAIERK